MYFADCVTCSNTMALSLISVITFLIISLIIFIKGMNLTYIIETNDCLIFVGPLKICNLCCLLKAAKISKIYFEKFATDSTELS